ncbi:MAG: hypothetical protein II363_04795 [Clostridia bacterium]|nr:hypothetical protein [Clostridia bacterium]
MIWLQVERCKTRRFVVYYEGNVFCMRQKGKTMARERYLVGVKPEELQPAAKAQPPQTPRDKWDNFWYHYKWIFLGIVGGVIALVVLVAQSLSVDKPDYTLLLVTDHAYADEQLTALEETLSPYGRDLDADGKVEVQALNVYLPNDGSSQYYTNSQVLQTHLVAGDVFLFAFEPAQYARFAQDVQNASTADYTFFASLPVKDIPLQEGGTAWNWAEAPQREGLSALPENLIFGVRAVAGTAAGKQSEKAQQQDMALLCAFMKNQPLVEQKTEG